MAAVGFVEVAAFRHAAAAKLDNTPETAMRKFLGIFLLRVARPEHAQLLDVLRNASAGDLALAFTCPSTKGEDKGAVVAYLFTLQIPLKDLDFSRILLRGDEHLIVEVGDLHRDFGFGVARAWLSKHETYPDRK